MSFRRPALLFVPLPILLGAIGVAAVRRLGDEPSRRASPERLRADLGEPYSNIHRGDYVGPEACAECHPEKHAAWRAHPHSRMNADASAATVLGDFSGVAVRYGGDRAVFDRAPDGAYRVSLHGANGVTRRYRVTRTVGSRFTQMYIGVQTEGPEPPGDPVWRSEGKLPFGWWIGRRRWFPEVYFDSDTPPEYAGDGSLSLPVMGTHARASWTENCIYCHNTYPYEERLLAGRGAPGFPDEDLALARVREGASPGLAPEELVTLGVSCESCHFGGREHAERERPIRFLPSSPDLYFAKASPELLAGARESAYVINSICGQCHFARGVSTYPGGAGIWNSREAVDLASGACAGAAKCTDCHDPHVAGPPEGGASPDAPAHVAACVGCHAGLPEEHAQHPAEANLTCLDCHMPRIVQGLEHVVRTHQISSPTDERTLAAAAPNACNLCHLDRPIGWTLGALAVGWGRRIEPGPGWEQAYGGSLDAPVGEVWMRSPRQIDRLVAADAWSRSPMARAALPVLIRTTLSDPWAVNRMFGLFAVERILGEPLGPERYDPIAPPAERAAQQRRLLEELEETENDDRR